MNRKSLGAGVVFILVGVVLGTTALLQLRLGTPARMGPGFFPLLLSGLLIAIGLAVILSDRREEGGALTFLPLRTLLPVVAAPILFGLSVRGLGLAPAILLSAFVAGLAERSGSVLTNVIVAAGLVVLCVSIFTFGLGIPIKLIGPWLGG